jgi:hypothetical protein
MPKSRHAEKLPLMTRFTTAKDHDANAVNITLDAIHRAPRTTLHFRSALGARRRHLQQAIDAPHFVTVTICTGGKGLGARGLAACTPAGGPSRTEPLSFMGSI